MATVEPDHGDILVMWLPKEIPELIYIEELLSWAATAYRKNDVSTFSLLLKHRFAHCNRLCLKEKSWHRRLYKHQCQMNTKWFCCRWMGKIGRRALNVRAMSWPGMRAVIIYQQSGSHHQEFALCSQNEKPSIGSDWMFGASFIRCTLWLPLNNNNNRRKKQTPYLDYFLNCFSVTWVHCMRKTSPMNCQLLWKDAF